MTITKNPASSTSPARDFIPDINDPTAGSVAISRELAPEQVRMIADPAPLGLAAFALTTFLLSLVNAASCPKTPSRSCSVSRWLSAGSPNSSRGCGNSARATSSGPRSFLHMVPSGCPSGPT